MLILFARWLLFNTKNRYIFGIHIPLTPGILISKRDWAFNKVRAILHDYLRQAESLSDNYGYLAKWEKLVYETVMENAKFMDDWVLVPNKWKEKIKEMLAKAAKGIANKVLRQLIPHLIEQLQFENKIDEFDEMFSGIIIREYYNKYVHHYLIKFFLIVNFLIGISNMILYLIIA